MSSNSSREHPLSIYQPLIDSRAIRLVTLLPGTPPEPICIDLDIVSVDSCTAYEALSYAWDDQKPSALVYHGKQSTLVTQNVHDALLELRFLETTRYLWIDQICINQQDLTERSKQISLMGDIYTRAKCAIVWLGQADHDAALAFDTIRKLLAAFEYSDSIDESFFVGSAKDIKVVVDTYCADGSEEMRAAMLDLPVIESLEFRSLLGLLRRTWFKRMWVFQEVVLASDLTEIRCGPYASYFQDFYCAIKMFERCKYSDYLSSSERGALETALTTTRISNGLQRERRWEVSKFNLELLLVTTKMLLCQNPRDKVYAILGVCGKRYLPYITPDYTQSIADTYCAVVRATLAADRTLTILSHIQSLDAKTSDLPSWTPDWRETRAAFGVDLGHRSINGTKYFDASNNQLPVVLTTENPHHLALRGTRFRRITRCIPDRITLRGDDIALEAERYKYSDWCDMYRAEAARLAIPKSCFRTRGYGLSFADDILCHPAGTGRVSSETLLGVILRRTLTADLYPRPINSRSPAHEWLASFPHCARWARQNCPAEPGPEVLREHDEYVDEVVRSRQTYIAGKEPDDAFLCLAGAETSIGDWICILAGGDAPFVLRERSGSHTWEFICECYVDGIMDGEFFQAFYDHDMETFVLD